MRSGAIRRVLFGLSVLVPAVVALPVYRAIQDGRSCAPENWVDWHLAMRQQCLTPRYVCENMTTAKMLRDPELSAAYRQGLAAGIDDPIPMLSEMVGRMRRSYGCSPERSSREDGSVSPGPVHGAGPRERSQLPFQPSPSVTL